MNNEKYASILGTVESHKQSLKMFNNGLKMGLSMDSQAEFIHQQLNFGLINHECYAKVFVALDQLKTEIGEGVTTLSQQILSMKQDIMMQQHLSEEEFAEMTLPAEMNILYHKLQTLDEVLELIQEIIDPALVDCVALQASMISTETKVGD